MADEIDRRLRNWRNAMNGSKLKTMTSVLIGSACLLAATSSSGADFNLRAGEFDKDIPLPGGGTKTVRMWGFALNNGPLTSPGPALTVGPGDTTLRIHLRNSLSVPVSLVIPNQNGYERSGPGEHVTFDDAQGRARARSFVKETPPTQLVTYEWNNVQPGTYLYYSGTHSALQVQMGLYGMLKKNSKGNQAYPGISYIPNASGEQVWIFGEVDFEVHDAVQNGTYETAVKSMIHSVPEVQLLNGQPFTVGTIPASNVGAVPRLVRMLNACYDERIPVVNGYHLTVIAEDGRRYPYDKTENAVNLPALKTRDARLSLPGRAEARFYDRRLLSMQ